MTWFRFDADAYDADTMHLSAAEDGVYSRLLRHYYRYRQPLPDNDRALAAIARVTLDEWGAVASVIRGFFRSRGGKLHQKHADTELDREDGLMKKRSENAKKAAEIRHRKHDITCDEQTTGMAVADQSHADALRQPCDSHAKTCYVDEDEDVREEEHPPSAPPHLAPGVVDLPKAVPPTENAKARGSRLEKGWEPDVEAIAFAEQSGLSPAQAVIEADRFRDYWHAKPGAAGRKVDWAATWRNWCRKAAEPRGRGQFQSNAGGGAPTASAGRVADADGISAKFAEKWRWEKTAQGMRRVPA